jgi:YD repeat-containing protein
MKSIVRGSGEKVALAAQPAVWRASPPIRIPVKEPARVKLSPLSASALRPRVLNGMAAHGMHVDGPPMLRATEVDHAMAATRRRATQQAPVRTNALPGRAVPLYPPPATRPGTRRPMSLPSDPYASGTGINHWWPYQEESVPGGGRLMANVGTGNVLLQDDDMAVPHKGIAMVFRRTYNSQSSAAVMSGDLQTWKSLYGNGWTNTFDAHVIRWSPTQFSVFDIDGARNDYVMSNGQTVAALPGDHATLTSDGACGLLWQKKSGMIYYFYDVNPATPCSTGSGTVGGYAGRLHQIIGRNRNTYITLSYSWDNGDASATGKISAISATTESGMTATLSFADFNGRRLLQQITYPDGTNFASYGYDSLGNLTWVAHPPNNSAGTRPQKAYVYGTLGSDSILSVAASARWNMLGDGGYVSFSFNGNSAVSSTLAAIGHAGVMNFTPSDGTNTVLQPGVATGAVQFLAEYFTTGVTTPTLRDTDGHMTNWIVDGSGRPTQTQTCTAATNQGQCPSQDKWLISNTSWDGNNNLLSFVDPRGAETDYAYDAMGNVVAIAQPPQTQGGFRPTTLIDYDADSNVVAVCDPYENNSTYNWTGQYGGGSDSYCTNGPSVHARFSYTKPSYEPKGELTQIISPSGYARTIVYDPAAQGGTDFGLPTRVYGAQITQFDQTPRTPSSSAAYDANGNVVCSRADSSSAAASIMSYDSMNRLVASADPDDASLTSPACTKTAGLSGSAIVTTRTYYADGSLATTQDPSQAAASYCTGGCMSAGTLYTYDYDGNPVAEAPYHSSPVSPMTATMRRWFDGAGRLVETAEPADPNTTGDFPILMRYLYDLTGGGTPTTLAGVGVTAHGNLFNVRKNTPTGWTDFTYSAYDTADRVTSAYAFAPCPAVSGASGPIYCSQGAFSTRYDWDSSPTTTFTAPGLLVAAVDGLGESKAYMYDGDGNKTSVSYGGDGGVTPNTTYQYDANSRLSSSSSVSNTVGYTYSADGQLSVMQSSSLSGTTSYNYYPDGALSGVSSVASPYVNVPNLYQYSYRNDGLLAAESFGRSAQSVAYTYTAGGRLTAQTDFSSSPSLTESYDGHGRIATYTTPAGSYGSITYDPEGRMLQYAAFNGVTATSQYNIRGDLVARSFQPNYAQYPTFQYRNVQGALVQNVSDEYDGRTGAPLVLAGSPNPVSITYDAIGRMVRTNLASYAYDAENRLVSGDTKTLVTAGNPNCASGGSQVSSGGTTELSYSYDSTGQLGQDVFLSSGRQYTRSWSWDRGKALYTLSSISGGNQAAAFEADGVGYVSSGYIGAPDLTLTDRDFDGAIAIHHNRTGNSAWWASNPYHQECITTDPVPGSANYVDPGNPVPTEPDGTSSQPAGLSPTGRATLSRANGFATPDYSSSRPYSARRALDTNPTGCPPGTVPRVQGLEIIGCTTARPCFFCSGFDPFHETIEYGDPFGFHWPKLHIPPSRPKVVTPTPPPPNCHNELVSAHIGTYKGSNTVTVCSPFNLTPRQSKHVNCALIGLTIGGIAAFITRGGPAAKQVTSYLGSGFVGTGSSDICENLKPPPVDLSDPNLA